MSEKAIEKLKKKVILVAGLSFLCVMLFIAGLMYVVNLILTRQEIGGMLDYIAVNDGELPEEKRPEGLVSETDPDLDAEMRSIDSVEDLIRQLQKFFDMTGIYDTPEFFYSTRYFAVIFPDDEEEPIVKISHIAAVEEHKAITYARFARHRFFKFGSFGDFYYKVSTTSEGEPIVIFLDCTSQIAMGRRLLISALILIGAGVIISFVILRMVAGRIIAPEVKSAELQKQFITNASHELKTPLAVIRANTELIEAMNGETEWTQSTMRQVDRLQGLIQNLVLITRAQERDSREDRTDTDVSQAIAETVETFLPVAGQEDKKLTSQIPEGLHMSAQESEIRQLTSLLLDNAIKYCDEKGEICVTLDKKGRGLLLMVSNSYRDGKNVDPERFFDRFYREDQAHNQDKGGYGIGLSIAQNIVEAYKGSIQAACQNGVITFTCTLY